MTTRREFLGAAGAVCAVGAIGDATIFAQGRSGAAPGAGVDAELLRQLKTAVRGLRATGKKEHATHIASLVRLFAADARAKGLDARLQAELRTWNKADLLALEPDPARYREAARQFVDDPPDLVYVPIDVREQMYNRILAEGITPFLIQIAEHFEAFQGGEFQAIANRRDCGMLANVIQGTDIVMTVACFFTGGIPCAMLIGMFVGFSIAFVVKCW